MAEAYFNVAWSTNVFCGTSEVSFVVDRGLSRCGKLCIHTTWTRLAKRNSQQEENVISPSSSSALPSCRSLRLLYYVGQEKDPGVARILRKLMIAR